jgi:hypothetical protein
MAWRFVRRGVCRDLCRAPRSPVRPSLVGTSQHPSRRPRHARVRASRRQNNTGFPELLPDAESSYTTDLLTAGAKKD